MNVLVALDSFKGTLTAADACEVAAAALRRARPDWRIRTLPMADGGEGTAAALVAACGGRHVNCAGVAGPLSGQTVTASFGWLPRQHTAVVEMASASGLPLVPESRRDPSRSTTFGTGQLLRAACRGGARRILLTLGGSATVDGGTGAARALGWRFLDAAGAEIPDGGGALARLCRIVAPQRSPLGRVSVQALCDVDNPLCGPRGAAAVYGPQKGADTAMVAVLDGGLRHLAECIRTDVGADVLELPGAGAAGGFGAGAVAFLGADLVPGVAAVGRANGLDAALADVEWVVTGEGRFDSQSLQGKVVSGVCAAAAAAAGAQVAVLAGRIALPEAEWRAAGVGAVAACAEAAVPDRVALGEVRERLAAAAAALATALAG